MSNNVTGIHSCSHKNSIDLYQKYYEIIKITKHFSETLDKQWV